jgi:hypothetical protein
VRSRTNIHNAYGTGLELDQDTWKVVDRNKPTWVESTWTLDRVRIFKQASTISQILELVFSILLVFAVAITMYFWDKFVK